MKTEAMVCRAAGEPLRVELLDLRDPEPDEVLVEIMACGLCKTDLSQIEGKSAPYPFPVVVGHEGAGIVRAVGNGVTSLQPGDHAITLGVGECGECENCRSERTNICLAWLAEIARQPTPFSSEGQRVSAYTGIGALSRFVVMKERSVARIRDDVPFDLACTISCAVATGVGAATHTAHVREGSSVAVFGLGGIGLNVVQGARLAGAAQIIGIDTNRSREADARVFGLTDFVHPGDGDVVQQIAALTGSGADYTFECVGHEALMHQAFAASRVGGGCCTVLGVPPDGTTLRMAPFELQLGRSVTGSFMGNIKGRSQLPGLLDLYVEGRLNLDDLVTHRMPMHRVNEGFELMKSGAALRVVVGFQR